MVSYRTNRCFLRQIVSDYDLPASDQSLRSNSVSEEEMRKRLEMLRTEHRDLDAAIDALTLAGTLAGANDQLQIARLKKRKLKLKDQISLMEDYLIPDIIA